MEIEVAENEVQVEGSTLIFDDVIYDKDINSELPTDEQGRWTQLCTGHADHLEKEQCQGLISDGGQGICGVKGCSEESNYYYDF